MSAEARVPSAELREGPTYAEYLERVNGPRPEMPAAEGVIVPVVNCVVAQVTREYSWRYQDGALFEVVR